MSGMEERLSNERNRMNRYEKFLKNNRQNRQIGQNHQKHQCWLLQRSRTVLGPVHTHKIGQPQGLSPQLFGFPLTFILSPKGRGEKFLLWTTNQELLTKQSHRAVSNRWPRVYETLALPTELRWHKRQWPVVSDQSLVMHHSSLSQVLFFQFL